MLSNLLRYLATTALRSPWKIIVLMSLPAVALGAFAATVPLDLSFTGLMDRSDVEVNRYFDTVKRLNLGGGLPLLLRGPKDDIDAVVKELAPRLQAHKDVRDVVTEGPVEWLTREAPYLVDDDIFQRWLGLATRPDDAENAKALATALAALEAKTRALTADGVRVILVTLEKEPMSTSIGGGEFFSVQALTDEVIAKTPTVTGGYGGLAAIASQDQEKTLGMVQKLTPVTLLIVLLLLRLVEPDFRRLFAVAIPMLLSVGGTLGLVGLTLGTFTVLETLFGIMVFGLGIDFALHLIVRAHEETRAGKTFDEAVLATWQGAGRGVIAGAFTTSGAFFIVAMAPDVAARHLGVSGGIGLLYCLLLMLTVLPAVWALLARRGVVMGAAPKAASASPPKSSAGSPLRKIAAHAALHPRLHLVVALALFVAALVSAPSLRFETDLEKVFNRDVPAVGTMEQVQALFGLNSSPWFVGVDSLEEAKRVRDGFAADPTFGRVESITDILRPDRQARHDAIIKAHDDIETQLAVYRGLIPLVSDEEAKQMQGGITLLESLLAAQTRGPPTVDDLPPALKQQFIGPQGDFIVYAYAAKPDFDGRNTNLRRIAAQAVHPGATGLGALLSVILGLNRPWVIPVFVGILAFVGLLLALDMRKFRLILLSLIPVLWATTMTIGVLCWFNIPMNVLMTAVVPLIIGLGVDDGIHVVHRIREDPSLTVDQATASVGRAILMTTVTTCVSFSALLFTNHAGMEGMGLVMVIGLPLCLLASVTTLPAAAVLLNVSRPPQ